MFTLGGPVISDDLFGMVPKRDLQIIGDFKATN